MLDRLDNQPPDALLALIRAHAEDERPDKIDLGVGVYRTGGGDTPVFEAIKEAERRLIGEQMSKSYLGPEGDMGFVNGLKRYIFGEDATMGGRIAGMQTPGGTGAVRLALAVAKAAGARKVHLGTPSWPNHAQIIDDLGMEVAPFEHARDGKADADVVLERIQGASAEEIFLLQGSSHNPTGIDYSLEQWRQIARALASSPALALIDIAYQGLGEGMDEDVAGLRIVLGEVSEALIAYSCDKNFGLYRDRVGALYVLAKDSGDLDAIMSNANSLARANWSMPPDHGGAAVRIVLRDHELTQTWLAELTSMRERIRAVREQLAKSGAPGLERLAQQNGLFAMLPLTGEQVDTMRKDHGVYMARSGRINVAGLHDGNIDAFLDAYRAVAG